MYHMDWSWVDLMATPPYWQRVCWDLLQARLSAEKEAQEREIRKSKGKRS